MKRSLVITMVSIAIFSLIATSASAVKRQGGGKKSKSIQVRTVAVKSSTDYLSRTVGTLSYGAKVDIVGDEGNWYHIVSPAGYIPKNVVGRSTRSIDASRSYAATGVSHDETALAGKGFNPQVEGQYKRSNASLAAAYTQVDRIERMKVSQSALSNFIAKGKLNQ